MSETPEKVSTISEAVAKLFPLKLHKWTQGDKHAFILARSKEQSAELLKRHLGQKKLLARYAGSKPLYELNNPCVFRCDFLSEFFPRIFLGIFPPNFSRNFSPEFFSEFFPRIFLGIFPPNFSRNFSPEFFSEFFPRIFLGIF
jgi:hypothetical protein